jgi:hypothetical protein
MLPDTAVSLTETSDSDSWFSISTGFGGGVYVEVDTDGVGCGAAVAGVTAGGGVTGAAGCRDLAGLPAVGAAGEPGEATAGACVAASVTCGFAERAGPALRVDDPPLTGLGAPTIPVGLLSPEAVSWAGCDAPDSSTISRAVTLAATTTVAIAAAILGSRRGLATVTGLGNPSLPNCPDLCVTEVRWARPVGVSSVQTFMIRPRSPSGSIRSGTGSTGSCGGVPPPAMIRRKHSLRATARSQSPSLAGSRSPSSLARATTKVSSTTSADSACDKMLRQ